MQKRKRDIKKLEKMLKTYTENVMMDLRKGLVKRKDIKRLDIVANMFTNLVKGTEENEQL